MIGRSYPAVGSLYALADQTSYREAGLSMYIVIVYNILYFHEFYWYRFQRR